MYLQLEAQYAAPKHLNDGDNKQHHFAPTFRYQADLGEGAALRHAYLQLEAAGGAAHTKATFVAQAARSSYTLTEACLGGQLARHDVNVQQARQRDPHRMSCPRQYSRGKL